MNASLKHLLVTAAAACAMIACSAAAAAGAGTGTVGGVGRTSASGATGLAVHIDERGAAIIRAWRVAHGLNTPSAAQAVSPELAQQDALARQCDSSGGAPTREATADGAVANSMRVELCV